LAGKKKKKKKKGGAVTIETVKKVPLTPSKKKRKNQGRTGRPQGEGKWGRREKGKDPPLTKKKKGKGRFRLLPLEKKPDKIPPWGKKERPALLSNVQKGGEVQANSFNAVEAREKEKDLFSLTKKKRGRKMLCSRPQGKKEDGGNKRTLHYTVCRGHGRRKPLGNGA